jgi:hypothetical protein
MKFYEAISSLNTAAEALRSKGELERARKLHEIYRAMVAYGRKNGVLNNRAKVDDVLVDCIKALRAHSLTETASGLLLVRQYLFDGQKESPKEDDPHKKETRAYPGYNAPETFTRGDARFVKMEMQLNQALKWLKTSAKPEVERYITYVRDKLSYLAGHEDRWCVHSDPMPMGPEKFRPVDGVELEHINSPACPPSHNLKCNNCWGPLECKENSPYGTRRLHDVLLSHLRVIEEKGVDYWCPKCLQTYLIPMSLHDYHNNLKNSSETPREDHTNS